MPPSEREHIVALIQDLGMWRERATRAETMRDLVQAVADERGGARDEAIARAEKAERERDALVLNGTREAQILRARADHAEQAAALYLEGAKKAERERDALVLNGTREAQILRASLTQALAACRAARTHHQGGHSHVGQLIRIALGENLPETMTDDDGKPLDLRAYEPPQALHHEPHHRAAQEESGEVVAAVLAAARILRNHYAGAPVLLEMVRDTGTWPVIIKFCQAVNHLDAAEGRQSWGARALAERGVTQAESRAVKMTRLDSDDRSRCLACGAYWADHGKADKVRCRGVVVTRTSKWSEGPAAPPHPGEIRDDKLALGGGGESLREMQDRADDDDGEP